MIFIFDAFFAAIGQLARIGRFEDRVQVFDAVVDIVVNFVLHPGGGGFPQPIGGFFAVVAELDGVIEFVGHCGLHNTCYGIVLDGEFIDVGVIVIEHHKGG